MQSQVCFVVSEGSIVYTIGEVTVQKSNRVKLVGL